MPSWGRREDYTAATSTIVVLAAIGVFVSCNRDFIPPRENNDLAGMGSRFLNRAGTQGIDWRTTDDDPFAEAARLAKPVMVFVGTAASQGARRMDDDLFGNAEVWARLDRDFVSVRVDLETEPEWRSAFLPLYRSEAGTDPGYAIWFFKPNGQLLTWIGRHRWGNYPDYNDFLGSLAEVTQQFVSSTNDAWTEPERVRHDEALKLRQVRTRGLPDFDIFLLSLMQPQTFVLWEPGGYRVLLRAGYVDDARQLLRRDLGTPRVDLVDGGFFRISSGIDPMLVEFDKLAPVNADMLAVLAHAYDLTKDPLFEYWYRRTLECLKGQFMVEGAWSSYIDTQVAEDGRSLRNSYSPAALRTQYGSSVREFAPQLGLDPRTNPLMVPFLVDPDSLLKNRGKLDKVVESLRKTTQDARSTAAKNSPLDAAAVTVARTLEAANVMRDKKTIDLALGWAARLRDYRAGTDDVIHSITGRGMSRKWLGDFASYAEAMFQAYVVTGDEAWLKDGEVVLRRALELFLEDQPGAVVSVVGKEASMGPLRLDMPSIVDDGFQPALPLFMLACFRYGAVLGDSGLRQTAVDILERFASVANQSPTAFSSYFAAAHEVVATGCTVTRRQSSVPRVWPEYPSASANTELDNALSVKYVGLSFKAAGQ